MKGQSKMDNTADKQKHKTTTQETWKHRPHQKTGGWPQVLAKGILKKQFYLQDSIKKKLLSY
jgi:hypothetical protein